MIVLWLSSLLLVINPAWVFLPLFLLTYLLLNYRISLWLALVLLGILFDLAWAWPIGSGILIYGLFLLIITIYNQKFSFYNQLLLFFILALYSLVMLWFTNQNLSLAGIGLFLGLFFWLNVKLNQIRNQHFVNL